MESATFSRILTILSGTIFSRSSARWSSPRIVSPRLMGMRATDSYPAVLHMFRVFPFSSSETVARNFVVALM